MQCERCGSEDHTVYRTVRMRTAAGLRSMDCDTRIQRCASCGLTVYVECRKALIEVFDAEKCAAIKVTPEVYRQQYLEKDMLSINQLRLFE